jgi:hypothetical protein
MAARRSRSNSRRSALTSLLLLLLAGAFLASGGRLNGQLLNQDILLEVSGLPSLTAHTPHSADALLASLDTVFHDHDICCGKDSALEDSAAAADAKSLKDVAIKLEGRHLLGDGRPVKITAEYLTPDQVSAGHLIAMMRQQHAPLMEWNSHVYVVHGIVYLWTASGNPESGATEESVIHKFLLWDTRYSDSRREVVFDRTTEDANKVLGLLFLEAKLQ